MEAPSTVAIKVATKKRQQLRGWKIATLMCW